MTLGSRMRIGIMGGTFDPVHNGHLTIAKSAAEQLGLQQVLFMPTGNPHFKLDQHVTDAAKRARMVELAIAQEPLFTLDLREVQREGVTYTADTLEELQAQHDDAELFFFLGTDAARMLPQWRRAETVARLCKPVVLRRPGEDTQSVKEAMESSDCDFDAIYLDVPQVDISSTGLRQRIADGLEIDGMVPQAVAQYIAENDLYSTSSKQGACHDERR